ncbi:MAG: cyanophycin synthetase [Pirellulaceae bacterium]|nr:cyanophycin synthetase [Pirellulaceae bacterium]
MHFRRLFYLRGANIWSRRSCMEVWVDLGALKDFSSEMMPGFNERYKAWLPTVVEHRCSVGERGGFFQRLDRGTYLAHILEHTTLELETLAGSEVGFGRAREMSEEGVYKVAIRFEEESVGEACLYAARELLKACIYDLPYDVTAEVARLRDMADRRLLGPSTKAILAAAAERNIPFRRLTMGSLCVLGHGNKQRRIWTAETDRTGAIAESIAQDKALTKRLLHSIGVPVPEGRRVMDAEDAVTAAAEINLPVVVKPLDGNHGRAVIPNLTEPDDIRHAFGLALAEGSGVIVERFVPGDEHRLLVVGDRLVAAARGEPITVTADGVQSVQQLIENVVNKDPRRGEDESQPLSPVEINDALRIVLTQQKLTLESIPQSGAEVLIKRYDNLSMDVTDQVHPSVANHVVRAVQMVGLDIAGVDLVTRDISQPLEEQLGAIVEVNAGPGLLMHIKPSQGQAQPVGPAIIDHIFSEPGDARIPVITVTGSHQAAEVVRMLTRVLMSAGHCVGWSDGFGLHMNDQVLDRKSTSSTEHMQRILLNPQCTAAVVALQPESILREGMDFDRGDVAIVTDVDWQQHLGGEFDLYERAKVFSVFRCAVDVILPGGTAVLNAEDEMALEMKPLSQAGVILYGADPALPALLEHRAAGQTVVSCIDHHIVVFQGDREHHLFDYRLLGVSCQTALAVTAAAWHLECIDKVTTTEVPAD